MKGLNFRMVCGGLRGSSKVVSKGKLIVSEGRLNHIINVPHGFLICLRIDSSAGYSAPQIKSSGRAIKNQDKRRD